ncbi:hypothetical protein [Tautonia plasticadhaerens]|uniref:Uncharacterized protein n=1 Tax=Tautonia plasticadhaerens TaxID=2527974 RepID=A0A518H9K8_9BACT|nr:hypothetical protein [Tautonia plasticadhaerens]QDV37545.1 hypothetical protein ElP_54850 [Tautonia plasticadhaerens]
MSGERGRCPDCDKRRVLGPDGICRQCSAEFYRGATCSRCDLDLDDWGYCPNDRCPFFARHQDEGGADDEPVTPEEREHIERFVQRRRTGR